MFPMMIPEQVLILNKRNRFLITVISCPIYHWLEISRKVNMTRARTASDIVTGD